MIYSEFPPAKDGGSISSHLLARLSFVETCKVSSYLLLEMQKAVSKRCAHSLFICLEGRCRMVPYS